MSTGAYTQCQLFQYFVENTVLCAIFSPRKTFSFNSGVRQRILQVHVTMHKVPHFTLVDNTDGVHCLRHFPSDRYSFPRREQDQGPRTYVVRCSAGALKNCRWFLPGIFQFLIFQFKMIYFFTLN